MAITEQTQPLTYSAFEGVQKVVYGQLDEVATGVKNLIDRDSSASVLIFRNDTGEQIDLDLRGSLDEVRQRHMPAEEPRDDLRTGPGRPKLGVVAREVTLLPRHWEWLNQQRGGASVALRKLVEEARRTNAGPEAARQAKEATYRFLSVMAGNLAGFEEATRALYAGDKDGYEEHSNSWPKDIQDQASQMAAPIWA